MGMAYWDSLFCLRGGCLGFSGNARLFWRVNICPRPEANPSPSLNLWGLQGPGAYSPPPPVSPGGAPGQVDLDQLDTRTMRELELYVRNVAAQPGPRTPVPSNAPNPQSFVGFTGFRNPIAYILATDVNSLARLQS